MPTFPTTEPITLSVELGAGSVRIVADATTSTTIELSPARAGDENALALIAEAHVEHRGDHVTVHVPRGRPSGLLRRTADVVIDAHVPAGSRLDVRTESADVNVSGEVGETRIRSGSGDVTLDDVDGAVLVETGSGDIGIGTIAGDANVQSASGDVMIVTSCSAVRVHTASGDVTITTAEGDLDIRTASGDVQVREADAKINSRTASGDIELDRVRGAEVTAVSASGDIAIGVLSGISVWLDVSSLSGDVTSNLDPTETSPPDGQSVLQLRAQSNSGDITIRSA